MAATKTSKKPVQVYFDPEDYLILKLAAKQSGQPIATYIRTITLKEAQKVPTKKLTKFSDLPTFNWKLDDPNTSLNIDEYVY